MPLFTRFRPGGGDGDGAGFGGGDGDGAGFVGGDGDGAGFGGGGGDGAGFGVVARLLGLRLKNLTTSKPHS